MAMANAGTATAAKEVEDVVEGGEEEEGEDTASQASSKGSKDKACKFPCLVCKKSVAKKACVMLYSVNVFTVSNISCIPMPGMPPIITDPGRDIISPNL